MWVTNSISAVAEWSSENGLYCSKISASDATAESFRALNVISACSQCATYRIGSYSEWKKYTLKLFS